MCKCFVILIHSTLPRTLPGGTGPDLFPAPARIRFAAFERVLAQEETMKDIMTWVNDACPDAWHGGIPNRTQGAVACRVE